MRFPTHLPLGESLFLSTPTSEVRFGRRLSEVTLTSCCLRISKQASSPIDWNLYFDKEEDVLVPETTDVGDRLFFFIFLLWLDMKS